MAGRGEEAGTAIASHMDIDKVAFTGTGAAAAAEIPALGARPRPRIPPRVRTARVRAARRLDGGRQADHAGRSRLQPQARHARARRQEPRDRLRGRGPRPGGRGDAHRALLQPGPVLQRGQPPLRPRKGVRHFRSARGQARGEGRPGRPIRREDDAGPAGVRAAAAERPGLRQGWPGGGRQARHGRRAARRQGLLHAAHRLQPRRGPHDHRARGDLRAGHVDLQVRLLRRGDPQGQRLALRARRGRVDAVA